HFNYFSKLNSSLFTDDITVKSMNFKKIMMFKNGHVFLVVLFASFGLVSCNSNKAIENEVDILNLSIKIPAGPNSWALNNTSETSKMMKDEGIENWTDLKTVVHTYFKTDTSGKLHLGLNVNVPEGTSRIKVTMADQIKTIKLTGSENQTVGVGVFDVHAGYNRIEIVGV